MQKFTTSFLFATLSFIFLTSTFVNAYASTSTLNPNAIGNFDQWTLGAGSTKVNAVNSNDGDTTYIATSTNNNRQTFGFEGANVPSGSIINSVTVNVIARKTGSPGVTFAIVAEKDTPGGDISDGTNNSLTTTYATYSRVMVTNPFSGSAWTVSEVNNWVNSADNKAIKFGVKHTQAQVREARVTQIQVVVDYTLTSLNLSETFSLTDVKKTAPTKLVLDAMNLIDAKKNAPSKAISDTFSLADQAANAGNKLLGETLSHADSTIKSAAKFLTENINFTDVVSFAAQFIKNITDSMVFADTSARAFSKKLEDSINLSDIIDSTSTFFRTSTETVNLNDAMEKATAKALAEAIDLNDAVSSARMMFSTVSEGLALNDNLSNTLAKVVAQTLTLNDAVMTTNVFFRTLSESLTSSDIMNVGGLFVKTISESMSLSDSVSASTSLSVILNEVISLGDAVNASGTLGLLLSDFLDMTAVLGLEGTGSKSSTESIGMSDAIKLKTSTPVSSGSSIYVDFHGGKGVKGGGRVTFSNVNNLGTLSVVPNITVIPPPAAFTVVGLSGSFVSVDITTDADFSGAVEVCITYDDTGLAPAEESLIKLMHFTSGAWMDITTSLDITDNVVCGQTSTFSPFAVMRGSVPSFGKGGNDRERPPYQIVDVLSPDIVSTFHQPAVPASGKEITVVANIIDDVGVSRSYLLYFVNTKEPEFRQIPMESKTSQWYTATIPGIDVRTAGLQYWIYAEDFAGNTEQSTLKSIEVQEASIAPEAKASQTNLPPHVLEAIKPKSVEPAGKLEVASINTGSSIKSYVDKIIVRNVGNATVDNIRLMLSPEIAKSFRLGEQTIRSIEPKGNVTIGIELVGKPGRDMYGGLVGYSGEIIVTAERHTPLTLPVKIGAQGSDYLLSYLEKVASMANQRSRISLVNSLLNNLVKPEMEITTRDGAREISDPSEVILIKNTSDRTLNNVRIIVTKLGNAFLLDKYNIAQIAPNEEVSIQMISQIDADKYSPKDYRGEIIVAPDNGTPSVIPVYIDASPMHDSIDDFEVRIVNNEMTRAVDSISIKNIGNRPMDSVKIMLSDNMHRIFSIDRDNFRTIAPGEEVTAQVKINVKDLKTFMQNYEGEIRIVSEHHNMRTIPVKIQWNKVESYNFVIYARNGDITLAKDIINYLENSYQNVRSALGHVSKTTIYIVSTEEAQLLNGTYSSDDNVILICSCDDPKESALQMFIYRAIMTNYPTYYNVRKIENDNGNWLIDGMAKYIALKNNDITKYIDAFKEEPVDYQWYGPPTDVQYGAAITFFKYIEEEYGEKVLYRSLHRLGTGMVSNTRCDTVENCAVLWGVYDANGWDINKKRYTLDVASLTQGWLSYVKSYDVHMTTQN
ncbi:MAG: hypothetical protein QXN83_00450 [Nitrososphaerales archaeon]